MNIRYNNNYLPGRVCRDCSNRHVGCHGTCEKYKQASAEWEAHKNQINEAHAEDARYSAFKRDRVESTKKYMANHRAKLR